MSMISEQIENLRRIAKEWNLDTLINPVSITLNQAADTIETLSAKLQAANMENSDLISRSALLQEINGEENAKADQLMREWYAEMVDRQPAVNMERTVEDCGGWITDREPEESGYYLVTYHEWSNGNYLPKFDDIYVKRLHYQKSEQFTGWNYPKCIDKKAEEDMNVEVLAWKPLPEPYHEP